MLLVRTLILPEFSLGNQLFQSRANSLRTIMSSFKVVIVGGGPVGALAGLYAAQRGFEVEIYEMRDGASSLVPLIPRPLNGKL